MRQTAAELPGRLFILFYFILYQMQRVRNLLLHNDGVGGPPWETMGLEPRIYTSQRSALVSRGQKKKKRGIKLRVFDYALAGGAGGAWGH